MFHGGRNVYRRDRGHGVAGVGREAVELRDREVPLIVLPGAPGRYCMLLLGSRVNVF